MNKKILTFLTAAVMTCSAMPVLTANAAESGTCGENLTWTLDDSGTLTISGTGNMTDYEGLASPFCERSDIRTVIVAQGVQSIGYGAFYGCENLTQVVIPDTVSYFGGYVFGATPWLKAKRAESPFVIINGILIDGAACEGAVNIPDSVKAIAKYAFYGGRNMMTSVTIPDSVTYIGENAFRQCSKLTSVTLPDSITTIRSSTFLSCSALLEITIPESVTGIESSAFEFCESLAEINIPDSVEYIGDAAFAYCDSLTDVTIPESIKSIGRWAFSYCDQLTSVTIPGSVTEIGKPAFGDEKSVTIKGYTKSEAERHAQLYRMKFQSLGLWKGDLNGNGKVEIDDAQTVLNDYVEVISGEKSTLTAEQLKAADVNGDNAVSVDDAQMILNYYVLNTVSDISTTWGELLAN